MQLYCGDCLDIMKQIPDNSIDMICCDLPYEKTKNKWDKIIPFDKLWKEYNRITKYNGAIVLFGIEPFASALRMSNIKAYRYDWIWDKSRISGFLNAKKQPLRQHETISIFYRKQCTYNPQMSKGKLKLKGTKEATSTCYGAYKPTFTLSDTYYPKSILQIPQQRNVVHPTQKPVMLCEYLISTYTNAGDVVLDNCMGSGTTGIACVNTGREFIGVEIDEKYFEIAKERIYKAMEARVRTNNTAYGNLLDTELGFANTPTR